MRVHGTHLYHALVKICPAADNPAAIEDSSIEPMLRTIRAHYELDAPEPPADALAPLVESSDAHETNVSRAIALRQSAEMRAFRAQPRMCRRGEHEMTPDNTYVGKKGTQCNACRNASYRHRRSAAA
jgi:hypothetical protein